MAKATKKSDDTAIIIEPIATESIGLTVLGTSPIILNRMSEKARRELLMPKGRKTAADRAASLKHDPLEEFRASPYTLPEEDAETFLATWASAFKGAMMSAALRVPGTRKSEIGQLVWVEGEFLPLFGIPKILLSVTRSADMARTPDIRTRAIVPEWAVKLQVNFAVPLMNRSSVINLLAAAGTIAGVGDWRPEKGKGVYGQFSLVETNNKDVARIMAAGDREAQLAAMRDPDPYDQESASLLSWFESEVVARGKRPAESLPTAAD